MNLKQGQSVTAPNGSGAFNLTENSPHGQNYKAPRLIILQAQWQDDQTGVLKPAQSMEVTNVEALYKFLKEYYES